MAQYAQVMLYGSCKLPRSMRLQTLWIGEKATLESTGGGTVSLVVDGVHVPIAPGYYAGDIQLIVNGC